MQQTSVRDAIIAVTLTGLIVGGMAWMFGLAGQANYGLHAADNPCLLEAQSLLRGALELPQRVHDSAIVNGRIFNVFQPGQTLFFLAHLWVNAASGLKYFQLELMLVMLLSVGIFFFAVLRLSHGQTLLAACLTLSFFGGAPYMSSFPVALQGSVYRVNHCFSILWFALLLAALAAPLSARRCWWASAAVGLAMLFRMQNVIIIVLPILCLCVDQDADTWQFPALFTHPAARRQFLTKLGILLAVPLLAGLLIMGANLFKFGSPLETGYAAIYDGRTDYIAVRAQTFGLLSPHFLLENLFRTFWAAPQVEFDGWRIINIVGDPRGNSILFSQPLLLCVCLLGRAVRSARLQAFLAVALLLALPVWLYHNPGLFAPGYLRLSLDYAPLWFAALAVGMPARRPQTIIIPVLAILATTWALMYAILLFQYYPA